MNPQQTPHGKIAYQFACALVAGDFDVAHQMLSAKAKTEWAAVALQAAYTQMIEYFETPPTQIIIVTTLENWPTKQPEDIGWAYAAIAGESESEAVTVIVCAENSTHLVRSIEWGRP